MSRAFTREDDSDGNVDVGERPVSPHRNLVTANGLAEIDAAIANLRKEMATADRGQVAMLLRDLRYWATRRETAELSTPDPASDVVRFGMVVTIASEDAKRKAWTIVGEDEADAARGTISHVAPMAVALFGKTVGDTVTVAGREWEVVKLAIPTRRAAG